MDMGQWAIDTGHQVCVWIAPLVPQCSHRPCWFLQIWRSASHMQCRTSWLRKKFAFSTRVNFLKNLPSPPIELGWIFEWHAWTHFQNYTYNRSAFAPNPPSDEREGAASQRSQSSPLQRMDRRKDLQKLLELKPTRLSKTLWPFLKNLTEAVPRRMQLSIPHSLQLLDPQREEWAVSRMFRVNGVMRYVMLSKLKLLLILLLCPLPEANNFFL